MAMHPFSNTRLSVCSLESMSAQTYHLISIYEYVLFVSHHYPKKKKKRKESFNPNNIDINMGSRFLPDTKCSGQPDGSLISRLEGKKNVMALIFRYIFCPPVNRGLCRRFNCKERIWKGKRKQNVFPT